MSHSGKKIADRGTNRENLGEDRYTSVGSVVRRVDRLRGLWSEAADRSLPVDVDDASFVVEPRRQSGAVDRDDDVDL